ncbi:hypothetical protein IJ531_05460 [bacterium]|nr:hypothetical protein [bacterium]
MANDFSAAFTLLRGINYAAKDPQNVGTDIAKQADSFAQKQKNKAGITVPLEDFAQDFKMFRGQNSSNIQESDTHNGWRLFQEKNMFENKAGRALFKGRGSIYQSDLYMSEVGEHGGLQYFTGNKKEDLVESALAFAKADIYAIEYPKQVYDISANARDGNIKGPMPSTNLDGKLQSADFTSFLGNGDWNTLLKEIDLDGDETSLSAEEYASYLLMADRAVATDSLGEAVNCKDHADGLLTADEANKVAKMSNEEAKKLAQAIYDEYFKED